MTNITVRNIPNSVMDKIRTLSLLGKRSLNNEILLLLEKVVAEEAELAEHYHRTINVTTQINVWKQLCGKWEDTRSTADIKSDIRKHRSLGRDVEL